jgi:hypothetical protein
MAGRSQTVELILSLTKGGQGQRLVQVLAASRAKHLGRLGVNQSARKVLLTMLFPTRTEVANAP